MPGFKQALASAGLVLVAIIHVTSVVDKGFEGFRVMNGTQVQDHVDSLRAIGTMAVQAGAIFINAHSGCDSWTIHQARQYLTEALKIEAELGVNIVHETHRRRIFFNPFNFRDILADPSMAKVKINLDISHWVVVLERIFATEQSLKENGPVDEWWP